MENMLPCECYRQGYSDGRMKHDATTQTVLSCVRTYFTRSPFMRDALQREDAASQEDDTTEETDKAASTVEWKDAGSTETADKEVKFVTAY